MVADQEKPIAAICDIAGDGAEAGDLDFNTFGVAITWNIGDADHAVGIEIGFDSADGRLNFMYSGGDAAHIFEGLYETDRSVAAHSEISDIVEENHAGGSIGINGLTEQRSNHGIVAARFANDGRTQSIMITAKYFEPLGHRSGTQIGKSVDNYASRFASGVRINSSDNVFNRHYY